MELFDPATGITSLEDIDFTPIKAYLEEFKEAKKNRPTEEKKKEQEEKAKIDSYYKYCLFDGELEKVSNYMVEPPGIFRGRGEHPHAGKLKSRIVPEFVSINIGPDNPIPVCPIVGHCWKRVISNSESTWLAHFKDERNAKSNGKYVFLAAESRIKGENDRKKYEKARRLKAHIEKIRQDYYEKIKSQDLIFN